MSDYRIGAAVAVSDVVRAREFSEGKLGLSAVDDYPYGGRTYACGAATKPARVPLARARASGATVVGLPAQLTEREQQGCECSPPASPTPKSRPNVPVRRHGQTHVSNLLGKLGLRDRIQAVIYAYETGASAALPRSRTSGRQIDLRQTLALDE